MPASDQGASNERYCVIPRTLIFLTRENDVLLLKGSPHKRLWANLYNGVGGHIEPGEDVLTSARRELAEETGITAVSLWLCGVVIIDTGTNPGICLYVLRGKPGEGEAIPSKEGDLVWIPFDRILDLPLVEDLRTLLPQVLSMQPGAPPFSARFRYDEHGRQLISFG